MVEVNLAICEEKLKAIETAIDSAFGALRDFEFKNAEACLNTANELTSDLRNSLRDLDEDLLPEIEPIEIEVVKPKKKKKH